MIYIVFACNKYGQSPEIAYFDKKAAQKYITKMDKRFENHKCNWYTIRAVRLAYSQKKNFTIKNLQG